MPKCAKGHDNPPGQIFCTTCGDKVNRVETPPEPSEEDLKVLQDRIQALHEELLHRETEIKGLEDELKTVTLERNELAGKNPEVESIVRQLDEKDRALQNALQELGELRNRLPELPPTSPGSRPHLMIESHPIANPAFGITFDDEQKALDLSTTGYRIRASLERNSDGSVGLVIHPGATINVKKQGEKRWRRLDGGERLNTEAGMVLFDRQGVMNARLDRRF